VPWDRVHEEAERWEHVVSQDVVERMDEALGHPEFDVHGHAIPRSDGTVATGKGGVELRDLAPGTPARVLEVADRDPSLLREVSAAGLVPGALVQVSRTPAAGAKVAVAVGGRRLRLGWEAAGAVRTRPIAGERLP
jgi:DtxR family Mn-dependent transcriptional regulator